MHAMDTRAEMALLCDDFCTLATVPESLFCSGMAGWPACKRGRIRGSLDSIANDANGAQHSPASSPGCQRWGLIQAEREAGGNNGHGGGGHGSALGRCVRSPCR